MATLEQAASLAVAFPEVAESLTYGNRAWKVRGKLFVWERPYSKADIKRFGTEPIPDGPILGAMVEDLGEKEAVLASGVRGVFTIPHFDNFAAVLIQLKVVKQKDLRELIENAWLASAPAKLAKEYVGSR